MALHTDSAYAPTQPEYLALLCIESAVEGGTSLLMSAERLISLVFDDKSPEAFMENNSVTYVSLSNGRYKSAKSNIFYMKENKPCCKFTTLSTAIIPSSKSSGQKFLKTISMISDPKNIKHVKLSPWDLLFIDNSRWLHGRTPFQGNRKIIRYCFIKD